MGSAVGAGCVGRTVGAAVGAMGSSLGTGCASGWALPRWVRRWARRPAWGRGGRRYGGRRGRRYGRRRGRGRGLFVAAGGAHAAFIVGMRLGHRAIEGRVFHVLVGHLLADVVRAYVLRGGVGGGDVRLIVQRHVAVLAGDDTARGVCVFAGEDGQLVAEYVGDAVAFHAPQAVGEVFVVRFDHGKFLIAQRLVKEHLAAVQAVGVVHPRAGKAVGIGVHAGVFKFAVVVYIPVLAHMLVGAAGVSKPQIHLPRCSPQNGDDRSRTPCAWWTYLPIPARSAGRYRGDAPRCRGGG